MPITRLNSALDDNAQRLLYKLNNNLAGAITGDLPLYVNTSPPATVAETAVEGHAAPAGIGTPVALAGVSTLVSSVSMWARRASRTDNTDTVWWGRSSSNNSQNKPLHPGEMITISAAPGKLLDLSEIYIDSVTVGDGVEWESTV